MGDAMRIYTFLTSFLFLCNLGWAAYAQQTIQPRIVGPVHEGVDAVFVEDLQIGSEVHLNYLDADNEKVRIGNLKTARGPVRFETPSTDPVDALKSGWKLIACAAYPGSKDICSDPVSVKPVPTRLMAPPTFAGGSVLYEGAGCVGALPGGLLPGSTVVLRDLSDPSDPTPYEDTVVVQPGLNAAMSVEDTYWPRSQHNLRIAGQLNGRDITREVPLPLPRRYTYSPDCERAVDPPNFAEWPTACRRVLHLDSLAPGGQFGVGIDGGGVIYGPEFCAVTTDGSFLLGLPLKGNSTLKAQQKIKGASLAACRTKTVAVAAPLLPDFTVKPIATEQDEISIHNLVPGATLEVTVTDSGGTAMDFPAIVILARDLAPFTFGLGRNFEPGDKVKITEYLGETPDKPEDIVECGQPKVVEIPVAARPNGLAQLEIVEPVYACTTDIEVKNYFDGATVQLRGTGKIISDAGEKDFVLGNRKASVIGLDYVLEEGWDLTALQSFGSQVSNPSTPPVPVQALPNMQKPLKILRGLGVRDLRLSEQEYLLDICNPAVHVLDGVRGANIDIVRTEKVLPGGARQNAFRYLAQGRLSDPATTAIPVPQKALSLGDIVTAKQSLCGRGTESIGTHLRVGHKVFIENLSWLHEIDLNKGIYRDVELKLGCKATEPVTMAVESGNPEVMRVVNPVVTVNPDADSVMVRLHLLKAGRARLKVTGDYVVAQPSAANLARDELVEVRVLDWVDQGTVEFVLQETGDGAPQYAGKPDASQLTLKPQQRSRVTRLQNTSTGYCGIKLVDVYGPPGNRCLGAKLLDDADTPLENGYIFSFENGVFEEGEYSIADMTGVAEAKRNVDRNWTICTADPSCEGETVRLKLNYEVLSD